jgi:hypothetical protein
MLREPEMLGVRLGEGVVLSVGVTETVSERVGETEGGGESLGVRLGVVLGEGVSDGVGEGVRVAEPVWDGVAVAEADMPRESEGMLLPLGYEVGLGVREPETVRVRVLLLASEALTVALSE